MKILLLGGTGFVGSRLCTRLVDAGHQVVVWANNYPSVRNPAVEYVSDALDNAPLLQSILPDCSHIFHLASATTPGSSRLQPSIEIIQNVLPMAHLLTVVQKFPHVHFVFVSSGGALYGDQGKSLLQEQDSLAPISYYGAGKAASETFLRAYHEQTGNGVTILRPSNLYGPQQRPKEQFGIIPTLFDCVSKERTFQIWGNGDAIRDYLFVEDFVDLCQLTIPWSQNRNKFSVFNIGAGRGHSINELCDYVRNVTKRTLNLEYLPFRGVDVARVVLDSSAACSAFDWKASTSLEDGLQKTWRWFTS
jgi:UDP-glucose 4-epimerase